MKRRKLIKILPLTGLIPLPFFKYSSQNFLVNDCETTSDIEGPFYIPNAPFSTKLSANGSEGTPLFITGTVYAKDCQTPIKDALVDVWHASDAGDYENSNYRGRMKTDDGGNYVFETILPGKYLNGAQFRPRHLHYKVSSENELLTTQIYFEGDTSIPIDPWASDPSAEDRIIPLTEDSEGNFHGVADIYLDVEPIIDNVYDAQKSSKNGYLKSIYPNPIIKEGTIEFYLNKASEVRLELLDLHGKLVQVVINNRNFGQGFHSIPFTPNNGYGLKLTGGIYLIRLQINNQSIDSKRFLII